MEAEHGKQLSDEISVAVLGKGEDFELIHLDGAGEPIDGTTVEAADGRGLDYCGLLAFKDGQAGVRLAPDNPSAIYTMMFAGIAFARLVAERQSPQQIGDAKDCLSRLFALQDPRTA